MTLANAFAHIEPEEHLGTDERIQPSIAYGQILPGTVLGAADQFTNALTNGRQIAGLRWRQFDGSVTQERLEFRTTLSQQTCFRKSGRIANERD